VREQLRGERHRLHLLDREDPHARERAAPVVGRMRSGAGTGRIVGNVRDLRTRATARDTGAKGPRHRGRIGPSN
jgi:hypothetical protein